MFGGVWDTNFGLYLVLYIKIAGISWYVGRAMNLCPYHECVSKKIMYHLEEDMALLFLFLSGCCVQIFSLQIPWDLKWAECVQTVCGHSPFWVASPWCKTHLPWCTTQAFWLKNATFSKLLGGDDFIIFSRNSYNFLPFKYSFISAVLLLEPHLWAETSSWASLAFTSIYKNQNQHLSGILSLLVELYVFNNLVLFKLVFATSSIVIFKLFSSGCLHWLACYCLRVIYKV